MFGAFQTFGKLGAIGKAISAAWSPLALWPTGTEPGMWIDPSNLTSQWQDSTGTTPVATPGSVADGSNPVGLALDIRAGATVLTDPGNHLLQATSTARPLESARVNLLQYTEDLSNEAWSDVGGGTTATTYGEIAPDGTSSAWGVVFSQANMDIRNASVIPTSGVCRSVWVKGVAGETLSGNFFSGLSGALTGVWQQFEFSGTSAQPYAWLGTWDGATARTISLWHPQVEYGTTATPYQAILTDGSSYSSTGFPIYQHFDGVDDGMATATFAAGTFIDGMDCMIAVRRDSVGDVVLGLADNARGCWFGLAAAGSGSVCFDSALGTPTVWVDNAQLTGGTAVTRDTLNTALTVGDWHIMEFRDLDMSGYDKLRYGDYPTFLFNGARGDIMLYPSTAPTADKDKARQYLANKYGVTLP